MLHGFLFTVFAPLIIGWMLDYFLGDPEKWPHPIVWMGKWIAWGEKKWNNGEDRVSKGAVFAVGSILGVYLIVAGLMFGIWFSMSYQVVGNNYSIYLLPWSLYIIVSSILVFYCLAGHTLRKEVRMVFEAVDKSLIDGRKQVGRIVGRDTNNLSAQEVRTAALETLAENLSDGVVAPLFWYALLGVPGMLSYKMVNTLDSMIGYQNARYKDFGRWAAKIDDIANYIPARLTAFMMLCVAWLFSKNGNPSLGHFTFKDAFGFVKHFGNEHASPNSGWPEAALAYILNCRFGGSHNYFGENFYKPYIGTNERELNTADMKLSIGVCFGGELMMVIITLMTELFRVLI